MSSEEVAGGGEVVDSGQEMGGEAQAPDYLLEGYQSAEDQARAYHQLHSQYKDAGVPLDKLAHMGRVANQWYNSNPHFREISDKIARGEPLTPVEKQQVQQAQQQQKIFYDGNNEEESRQWWERAMKQPDQVWPQVINHHVQPLLQPLQQLQQEWQQFKQERAREQLNVQYGEQLKQLPLPLLQAVERGRLHPQEAIQIFQATGQGKPGPSQPTGETIQRERDQFGKFASSGGKSSPGPGRKIETPADARAEAKRQLGMK